MPRTTYGTWRLALVVIAFLCAIPSVSEAQRKARTGRLEVTVSAPGADVAIDGVVVARSPIGKPLTLAVGTHTIKVTKPGHAEFVDVVKIKNGETTAISVDLLPFAASVTIDSTPPGADVTVDGKLVGATPILVDVDGGEHTFRVTLEGYADGEKTMKLVAGESYRVSIPLVAIPKKVVVRPKDTRPVYKKWWFWAATSAVVVGTTAVIIGATATDDPFAGADRVITPTWP